MKHFLLIFLLAGLPTFAQEKAYLSFQRTTIDAGTINETKTPTIEINFVFYNKGKTPLVIHKVKASCGCTIPVWSKKPIKAKGTGIIKVQFKPNGKKGHFMKTLFVESNSDTKVTLLKIKGKVE